MRFAARLLVIASVFSYVQPTFAEVLEVEYASFYSHVKKIDNENTSALRFAFGFKHVVEERLCHIQKATIVTQKQTLPMDVENNARFTVPNEKVLKMAKAVVQIELNDNANQCDMSVQLETQPHFLKVNYSREELAMLYSQYQAFFDEMGGIMSFLMPSTQGLVFHLEPSTVLPESLIARMDEAGRLILDKAWLEANEILVLPNKPRRITSLVKK